MISEENHTCLLYTSEDLRAVQTPQTFPLADIRAAHEAARSRGIRATDDAALLEKMGKAVHLVEGDVENIKLTTPEDMHVGEAILRRRGEGTLPVRVGQGYDVHRLVEGRRLILCGVEVPYERGLLGHSDADVAAHALMLSLIHIFLPSHRTSVSTFPNATPKGRKHIFCVPKRC